ncbi:MAG TPA: GNAT family N-acetyltransferase [Thermoanaerobaculia bacterium]|nr:GNAT family N-acetyltransferase [Thermoanaerobaculia bacterium]
MLEIRSACPEDADELTTITRAAKASWGYPEEWLARWREVLTITPEFIQENPVFVAVAEDGSLLGFVGLIRDTPARWTFEHLWIRPGSMGKGLGRMLTVHAADFARSHGVEELAIDAEPFAEPFYARMGAIRVGEVDAPIDGQPRVRPQMVLRLR